jgi:predicted membrane metal-binding protein
VPFIAVAPLFLSLYHDFFIAISPEIGVLVGVFPPPGSSCTKPLLVLVFATFQLADGNDGAFRAGLFAAAPAGSPRGVAGGG